MQKRYLTKSAQRGLNINELAQRKKYDLCVMGIPKTVDNDLEYTDNCLDMAALLDGML